LRDDLPDGWDRYKPFINQKKLVNTERVIEKPSVSVVSVGNAENMSKTVDQKLEESKSFEINFVDVENEFWASFSLNPK
jgi:hypothetical protein